MDKQVYHTGVLVIGAGPAGIAAAVAAAESGQQALLMDDNVTPGGQIWRGIGAAHGPATRWIERARRAGVTVIGGATVFGIGASQERSVVAENEGGLCEAGYERLIVATGARERFVPFPGWTLPGVTGAGGLQALVKGGWPIAGKHVVVAGSGPLLLAVAAFVRTHGADVRLAAEQASWSRLIRFALGTMTRPAVAAQALGLQWQLRGMPYHAGCTPIAAHGDARGALNAVTLRQGNRTWKVSCDILACGFDLVPNLELALLLGCAVQNGFAVVNEWQESSLPGVYCAGEVTGIGGVERALIEGQIAGYAAAGNTDRARALFGARKSQHAYAARLDRTFALRPELKTLATADTIVCRCEDVRRAQLDGIAPPGSWRAAKLLTRCGMGACQGRVCGPAVELMYGWQVDTVRPPLFPVRIETLAAIDQPGITDNETS